MDHSAPTEDAHAALRALIAAAVVEEDRIRRKALLIMADHWRSVLVGRGADADVISISTAWAPPGPARS